MANVGSIRSLAPEMENLIRVSKSDHNVKSGNLNLHQDVKWRSFGHLSKHALVEIIGILLKEVEGLRQPRQQLSRKEKSGSFQHSRSDKIVVPEVPRNVQSIYTEEKSSTSQKETKDPEETEEQASWKEVKPKRSSREHRLININQITQESSSKVASNKKSSNYKLRLCPYCRTKHEIGKGFCKAFNKCCRICGKKNHFAIACWFRNSPRSKEATKIELSQSEEKKDENELLESKDVDKETKEQNSLEESTETITEENALHWINMRLKVNHLTLEELRDGESLRNLLNKCCFAGKEHSGQGSDPWSLINRHLDLEDSTDYYDVELMKKGNRCEIATWINWVKNISIGKEEKHPSDEKGC